MHSKFTSIFTALFVTVFGFQSGSLLAQETFSFPLTGSFADETGTRSLVVIPNDDGETGEFGDFQLPATTCPTEDVTPGWYFERDAGFEFLNEGFLDCEYTLQIAFKFDDLDNDAGWVRILSFTHTDDIGLYLNLSSPPSNATLEFWPAGTVGEPDFFNDTDVYQLTLVRDCSGMMDIYINGQLFAEFDDSSSMHYVPQEPNDYIVFFRDHPYELEDEASPGWTKNLLISNAAWDESEVLDSWQEFCTTLTTVSTENAEQPVHALTVFPNPATDRVFFELPDAEVFTDAVTTITDITGRQVYRNSNPPSGSIEVSHLADGLYITEISDGRRSYVGKFLKK